MISNNVLLEYAINAYSFLINKNSFKCSELGNAIENFYGVSNAVNHAVIELLLSDEYKNNIIKSGV